MPQTDFNWSEPFNVLLLALAIALLVVQCGLLYKRHRHSGRFGVRLVLNVLLGVSLFGWMMDPYRSAKRSPATGLLIAKHIPGNIVRHVKDSLSKAKVLRPNEIGNTVVDTLVIVGNEFDKNIFASIRQATPAPYLQWIPCFDQDEMQDLHWKGVLRKGEMQRIEGELRSSRKQVLQVRYGDQILDSTGLHTGHNRFRLTFPAFGKGRTTTTLLLNGQVVDTLRFFFRPEEKLTVRFLLESPDFETRNLTAWLGRNGHPVLYDAVLSRNIESKLNINRAREPDLIITTPANAGKAAVKKLLSEGKSVLFLGLSDPLAELRSINHALGTNFWVKKTSNDESVPLSPELNALPFRFEIQNFQLKAAHYPVVVEKTSGKIAVSLLNETFPLLLSGDSIAYGKVWNEILAWTRPASGGIISWDGPVFKDLPTALAWNNFKDLPAFSRVGKDTVVATVSALNDKSATARFVPWENGWLPMHDSLGTEMYVQEPSPWLHAAQMQDFIRSSNDSHAATGDGGLAYKSQRLPAWGWFVWLMVCLTALWIEPKL